MNVLSKPFYLKVFFFIAVLLLIGCSTSPEEKKTAHYQKGMEYVNAGEYRAAVIEFRNAVQIDPSFAEARYQLGLAYLKTEQPGNALGELERAASLDPSNKDALIKAAELYLLARQIDKSRELIQKMIAAEPGFSDAHALLARAELAEGRREAARKAITRALELHPDNDGYYIVLGQVLTADQRLDEAEESIKKAVEIDPSLRNIKTLIGFYTIWRTNDAAESAISKLLEQTPDSNELHLDLANFYTSRGRLDEAEKYILSAVEQHSQSPEMHIYLGNFYLQTRMPDKAEKAFLKAIDVSETPVNEKAILADFYFKTRQYEPAATVVDSALESNPGHAQANLVKAKLLVREQENSRALAILDQLTKDFPRWGEVYYQKGVAHLNKGEIELSYRAADTALQHSPGNPEANTLMAHHLILQRKFGEAKSTALSALQAMPGNMRAGIILGRAMLYLNETDGAIKLFENMADREPENVELLFNQAEAYIAGGRIEDALTALKKALSINPDFAPAMAAISELQIKQGNIEKAIADIRHQLRQSPDNPHYMIMLAGLINNHASSADEALALLAKARETAPDIPRIYSMTASILIQQGKIEEAIENYQAMIRQNPETIEGRMALGTLMEQSGNKTEAMKAYSRVLEIRPGFAPAANNLAWLIAKSEQPDLGEAMRLALMAKEAYPEDPHIADTLGYIHYKRGSYQLALTQFTQAIEKRPDMPVLHYHLGLTLHANGQTAEAKNALEKALAIDTHFPEQEKAVRLLAEIKNTADITSGN